MQEDDRLDAAALELVLARGGPLPLSTVADVIDRLAGDVTAAQVAGRAPPDLLALVAAAQEPAAPGTVDVLDPASAQFWLAAVAYRLLTGQSNSLSAAGQTLPMPIRSYRPEVSAEVEALVLRGLATGQDRFASVAELASSFRRAVPVQDDAEERTTVSSVPSGIAETLRRPAPVMPNDEQTVVSTSHRHEEPTVVASSSLTTQRMVRLPGTVVGRPAPAAGSTGYTKTVQVPRWPGNRRSQRIWMASSLGGLAVGGIIVWLLMARGPGQPATPPAPPPKPVATAPIAAAPPRAPAPAAVAPPPPAPAPEPAPPPAVTAARAPEIVAIPAVPVAERPRRPHARAHGVTAASEPSAAAAPDGPKNCRLSVASYPWAEVWVDGADTGLHTPVVGLPLSCGKHRLEFKRTDLKVDQRESITLTEGNEFRRQYELRIAGLDE